MSSAYNRVKSTIEGILPEQSWHPWLLYAENQMFSRAGQKMITDMENNQPGSTEIDLMELLTQFGPSWDRLSLSGLILPEEAEDAKFEFPEDKHVLHQDIVKVLEDLEEEAARRPEKEGAKERWLIDFNYYLIRRVAANKTILQQRLQWGSHYDDDMKRVEYMMDMLIDFDKLSSKQSRRYEEYAQYRKARYCKKHGVVNPISLLSSSPNQQKNQKRNQKKKRRQKKKKQMAQRLEGQSVVEELDDEPGLPMI